MCVYTCLDIKSRSLNIAVFTEYINMQYIKYLKKYIKINVYINFNISNIIVYTFTYGFYIQI